MKPFVILPALAALLLLLAAGACGDDDSGGSAGSPTEQASADAGASPGESPDGDTDASPGASGDAAEPTRGGVVDADEARAAINPAIDEILAAILAGDADAIREHLSENIGERVSEQGLERLTTCVPEGIAVEIAERRITPLQDRARVDIEFAWEEGGQTRTNSARWEFLRAADGTYGLRSLPDCPYRGTITETPAPGEVPSRT